MPRHDKAAIPTISNSAFRTPFVFFGNETLATGVKSSGSILQTLIDNKWIPDALILAQRKPAKKPHKVEEIAKLYNIPIEYVATKYELTPAVERYHPSFGVLAAFGMIIDQSVFDLMAGDIANIHPSLLPKYRGTAPIEQTIIDDEQTTGVSLMKLDSGMDTGPLYDQRMLDDDIRTMTKQQLHDQLVDLGARMLMDHIDSIATGTAKTSPQPDVGMSVTSRIQKNDGEIDWHQPAAAIERGVRAYAGWPKSITQIDQKDTIIREVAVTDKQAQDEPGTIEVENKQMFINADDYLLEILSIQPAGKPQMKAADYINGYLHKS